MASVRQAFVATVEQADQRHRLHQAALLDELDRRARDVSQPHASACSPVHLTISRNCTTPAQVERLSRRLDAISSQRRRDSDAYLQHQRSTTRRSAQSATPQRRASVASDSSFSFLRHTRPGKCSHCSVLGIMIVFCSRTAFHAQLWMLPTQATVWIQARGARPGMMPAVLGICASPDRVVSRTPHRKEVTAAQRRALRHAMPYTQQATLQPASPLHHGGEVSPVVACEAPPVAGGALPLVLRVPLRKVSRTWHSRRAPCLRPMSMSTATSPPARERGGWARDKFDMDNTTSEAFLSLFKLLTPHKLAWASFIVHSCPGFPPA